MLKKKVVLVTGAASGIGRAIALMAVREGACLVLSDISAEAGLETTALAQAQGGEAIFVAADVGNAEECQALVSQAMAHYGHLDVACNNAGVGGAAAPLADYPLDAWAQVINTNLNGVFYGMRAQIAANEKGVQELQAMVAQFGRETVAAYMGHVQDNAEESVRRVITALKNGEFTLPLDNGAQIRVRVTVDAVARSATVDFTGTSAQLPNNFNAPRAITMAAVLYVFRTLVDDDIPLNAGCLKPIEVIVPDGCMLNPLPPAAVVAR
ncbi:3-phenylpropionate-dihydrodiol/cinnamic acid-dihydrodiol dehydrogenase [compost metagenome]